MPVLLPPNVAFRPTGESPLKYHEAFVNTVSPIDGTPARRETDTMDVFMDSSWYQFRYTSPGFDEGPEVGPIDPAQAAWLPVDQYTGGIEHAVMHLLYTRFFTKACRDMGIVNFDEPMVRLFNQGIIYGEDGFRMSKSRGNVINPDDYVSTVGTDVYRMTLMFRSPWDVGGPWQGGSVDGVKRFVQRAWAVVYAIPDTANGDAPEAEGECAPPFDASDDSQRVARHGNVRLQHRRLYPDGVRERHDASAGNSDA